MNLYILKIFNYEISKFLFSDKNEFCLHGCKRLFLARECNVNDYWNLFGHSPMIHCGYESDIIFFSGNKVWDDLEGVLRPCPLFPTFKGGKKVSALLKADYPVLLFKALEHILDRRVRCSQYFFCIVESKDVVFSLLQCEKQFHFPFPESFYFLYHD